MSVTFTNFLHKHGILSAKQTENYPERIEDQENASTIFQLADFFKSLTPSDCYDLALRLYLLYKKQDEKPKFDENKAKKLSKLVEKLSQMNHKLLKLSFDKICNLETTLRTFEGSFRQGPNAILQARHMKNKSLSQKYFDSDDANNSALNTSSIHERLYNESASLNTSKLLNEEKKYFNEIKGCTFQPKSSAKKKSLDSGDYVFKRLQKDYRRESEQQREVAKLQLELRGCTFQPNATKASVTLSHASSTSNLSEAEYPKNLMLSNTFERLHNESAYKKSQKMENEILKHNHELSACSFTPRINSPRKSITDKDFKSAREVGNYRSEFLYADHFDKKRIFTRKILSRQEEDLSECTFKPKLVAKTPENMVYGQGHSYERMVEWEREKNEKIAEKRKQKDLGEATVTSPTINPRSRDLSSNRNGPAHERLYRAYDERKLKQAQLEKKLLTEAGASFTPRTNVKKFNFNNNVSNNSTEKIERGLPRAQQSTSVSRNHSPNKYDELNKLKERLRGQPFVSVASSQNIGLEESGQHASNDNKENTRNKVNTIMMSPSDHKKIFQQSLDHKQSHMRNVPYLQGDQNRSRLTQGSLESSMHIGEMSSIKKNENIRPFNLNQLDLRQQQNYPENSLDDSTDQF